MRDIKFRAWDRSENKIKPVCFDVGFDDDEEDNTVPGWRAFEWPEIYELMQYTGLKDRNGKKIYEGDIIKSDVKGIREVYWSDDDCGLVCDGTSVYRMSGGEVIGNIYENPELLEEKRGG